MKFYSINKKIIMDVDFNNPGLTWKVDAAFGSDIPPIVGFLWGISVCLGTFPYTPATVRSVAAIATTVLGNYAMDSFFKWSYGDKKRFIAAVALPITLAYLFQKITKDQRVRNQP